LNLKSDHQTNKPILYNKNLICCGRKAIDC